jgi:membrane protease YdiL (CAAX protease family)
MELFAVFLHRSGPSGWLAPVGLLVAALAIIHCFTAADFSFQTFGFTRFSTKVWLITALGALGGIVTGIMYRWRLGYSLVPDHWGWFALLAGLIGSVEELVYRGYIQGRLGNLGPVLAVVVAALYHAAYKWVLFVVPPPPEGTNLLMLAVIPFAGGLFKGALREITGSVAPPVAAHASWDVIVYGELSRAPWWVWS